MNFKVVEGAYANFDEIKEDLTNDYLYSNIPNPELKKKYGLTKGEWKEFTDIIKKEHDLKQRPRKHKGKYYYANKRGFQVVKHLNGTAFNFGTIPTEEVAKIVVEKCKEANWDIDKCYEIVHNWREYI